MLRYYSSPFKIVMRGVFLKNYTKKEAIQIITSTARLYSKSLLNKNFLFIYRDRKSNSIQFFETIFLARHFQHLCGVEFIDKDEEVVIHNASFFFDKCTKGVLAEEEIRLREDGTTNLKLETLPKIVSFVQFSKMTVTYSGNRPKLSVDRFAGTVNYSLGFTLDGDYYMPSSCLLEDIRNLGHNPSQILAILSKDSHDNTGIYKKINYVAKGVPLDKLNMPDELINIIDLTDYISK